MKKKNKNWFKKLLDWFKKLFLERWELVIYFPGEVRTLEDGTKVEKYAPKTYQVKKVKKLTEKHMIFIEENGNLHEVRVVSPVGYDLTKVY